MGLTGFMLWNPIVTANALPGQFIPAAKAAHGAEAILAVLAIFVWHFYHVHLKRWNWSMINGRLSREEMEEEHALELEEIEAGQSAPDLPAPLLKRRQALYIPIAGLLSIGFLALIFWFLTSQPTAIKTLPPSQSTVPVFVPITATPSLTPEPSATPEPGAAAAAPAQANALSWKGEIGALFDAKCKACHGTAGGVNLSSYAAAMEKGEELIAPGDAENSPLVKQQSQGGHAGQFSPEELEKIKAWIAAGAPEE
jgi:mono/diheme cytochrome c family protein